MINRMTHRLRSLADFVNVRGDTVLLYGCSYVDIEELMWRVDQIRLAVQSAPCDSEGVQLGFDSMMLDKTFRQHIERCLELHGLALSDVSLRHIQSLLLYNVILDADGQPELQPGLLVQINMPRTAAEATDEATRQLGGDPSQASYEKALAVIATHTKSVAEAVELTRQMSVLQLTEYLEQSSEIQKQINGASTAAASSSTNSEHQDLLSQLDKYCV